MPGFLRPISVGDASFDKDPSKIMPGKNMRLRSGRPTTATDVNNHKEIPPNERTALKSILSYLKEYCKSSGVHGFRYLSEERRTFFEKLFWATAIAISSLGCAMMIAKIKTRMDTTPVIVTLAENPTKVWHIPFPAVTICPGSSSLITAFNYTKYLEFSEKHSGFLGDFLKWVNESKTGHYSQPTTPQSSNAFDGSSLFGNATQRNALYKKLWALQALPEGFQLEGVFSSHDATLALDEDDMDFLVEVAPKMNNRKESRTRSPRNYVIWKAEFNSLDEHFRHTWTEFGVCFTFNMMDGIHVYRDGVVNNDVFRRKGLDKNFPKSSNDWDPDNGYSHETHQHHHHHAYPWRAPHERALFRKRLTIGLIENAADIIQFWGKGTLDYKMMFHQPQDHPQTSRNSAILLPFHKMLDICINVDVVTTSADLKKYDPPTRQCYFSYEKQLKYFKVYSEKNCQFECLTNLSLAMCGCVAFYMPRFNNTKICGRDAYQCLEHAILQSDESEVHRVLHHFSHTGKSPFDSAHCHVECDCLPSCLSISYEADVLTTRDFDLSLLESYTQFSVDPEEELVPAGAIIKIKKANFIATRRGEYYGQIDFLASCGGFLGLFCGFSILSFIEIIYFLTIRLWTNVYRSVKSRPLPGPPEDLHDAEDPARKLAFDVPPLTDLPWGYPKVTATCVTGEVSSGTHKWKAGPALKLGQHWSDNQWQEYMK